MNGEVLRTDKDGVATLVLNRPEKGNALTTEMFEELEKHLDSIAREIKTIGLVILRGAGGHFSTGYDMAEIAELTAAHAKPHTQSEVIEKLANLPQPVICAVEGHCTTGALELALAADLIVAAESARFSDAGAKWGLTPIWGLSLRLPQRIGQAKARELTMTCRTIGGREAEAMHLANVCYPDDGFETGLSALVRQILANSWYANRVNKRVLIETEGLPLSEAMSLEMFKNEGLAPDAAQRVATFFHRRDPS
ncbi:MAG: enoyl-CoA hydratase/isomerase family protein [Telmatospirillum sp.]|nr:enoyl-CoA hydratase/isomerase family protein [Telmatospirillum sp.]